MGDLEKLMSSGAVSTVGDIIANDLVLVFDTETTGLPEWNQPSDSEVQPHIVQIAAELCRADGTVIETWERIINPGVPIPPETTAIHGITDEIAQAQGIAPTQMLEEFFALVDRAAIVVGYNTGFDLRLVRIQSARHLGQKWECPKPKDDAMWIVAKQLSVKKPKLVEAYKMVFGKAFDGAHHALRDCSATREIYFEFTNNRGYVAQPAEPKPREAKIGDNNPPADEPEKMAEVELETFDDVKKHIEDLYTEAKTWLDGEPIATEGQAAAIGKLRDILRKAKQRGEELRKIDAKPFDDGKAAVQAKYNPLVKDKTGLADVAISTCNSALAPWLKKIDDEQRAEALRLRQVADNAAKVALEAAQEAAKTADLSKRETAEDLLAAAKDTVKTMKIAEKAKPQVAGLSRNIGMKSVWHADLTDPVAAIEHYRKAQPAALKEWLKEQAVKDVRAGPKPPAHIPGFTFREERVPV